MTKPDVHGPVDVLVIEFPSGADGANTATALGDLIDSATVRLYDLMVVTTDADGSCSEVELSSDGPLSALARFSGARSGLLTTDDVVDVAGVLEPGKAAAVLVYENAWAVPFVAAARGEDGHMVATSRLSAEEIMNALDAAEAAE
jgi:uncharacterized membrane protein